MGRTKEEAMRKRIVIDDILAIDTSGDNGDRDKDADKDRDISPSGGKRKYTKRARAVKMPMIRWSSKFVEYLEKAGHPMTSEEFWQCVNNDVPLQKLIKDSGSTTLSNKKSIIATILGNASASVEASSKTKVKNKVLYFKDGDTSLFYTKNML